MILGWAVLTGWENVNPRGCTADGQEKVAPVTADSIGCPSVRRCSFARPVKGLAFHSFEKTRMHSENT
jgi:hypothetical protein